MKTNIQKLREECKKIPRDYYLLEEFCEAILKDIEKEEKDCKERTASFETEYSEGYYYGFLGALDFAKQLLEKKEKGE